MESKLREFFNTNFKDSLVKEETFRGDLSFFVKAEDLYAVCEALLDSHELQVKLLADITSVDWLHTDEEKDGRFEVVYNLYSIPNQFRFFIKVRLSGDDPKVKTVTDLWAGANWMEREVWDLMGIEFVGHPNLTKILTADELDGHPLRKDFPLTWEQPKFTWNQNDPPEVIK
ncbi:MAG: NADH-quinone oxidoreductase subunit C [Calditrichaeota bacterium]|nr:MAG: NADH-quinone oxidoreductase subunit C [Calditrichota bacterium]